MASAAQRTLCIYATADGHVAIAMVNIPQLRQPSTRTTGRLHQDQAFSHRDEIKALLAQH